MSEDQKKYLEKTDGIITSLVLNGDISKMTAEQKVIYYKQFCEFLGLNPLTKPFQILKLQNKEILYATKDATEQLRKNNGISVIEKSFDNTFKDKDIYIVNVKVVDKHGRTDIGTGAVNIKGLSGDALCNSIMKAETKAKRRATLSISGLGIIDETEIETIPDAVVLPEIKTSENGKIELPPEQVTEQPTEQDDEFLNDRIEKAKSDLRLCQTKEELRDVWRKINKDLPHLVTEKHIKEVKDKCKMDLDDPTDMFPAAATEPKPKPEVRDVFGNYSDTFLNLYTEVTDEKTVKGLRNFLKQIDLDEKLNEREKTELTNFINLKIKKDEKPKK